MVSRKEDEKILNLSNFNPRLLTTIPMSEVTHHYSLTKPKRGIFAETFS